MSLKRRTARGVQPRSPMTLNAPASLGRLHQRVKDGTRNGRGAMFRLLDEAFDSTMLTVEAQTVIGLWQNAYNRVRPHSSLGYRPPAPVTFPDLAFRLPMASGMQ